MPHCRSRGRTPDRWACGRVGRRKRPHAAPLRRDRPRAAVRTDRLRVPGLLGGRRRAAAGGARGRPDGAERRGRLRLLRARRPRCHGGGTLGGHAGAASRGRGAVRCRRCRETPLRGPLLRRRDGLQHRPPLAGPRRRAARDATRGPPCRGVHARRQQQRLAAPFLAHPGLPARGRRAGRGPALGGPVGGYDRGPHRAGARPVGLRRRVLRGLLASARRVLGRPCAPRDFGVDQSRAGGRATGGT